MSFALCRFGEARRALEALRHDGLGEEARARIDALLADCVRGNEALAPFLSTKKASEARAVVEKAQEVYRALHDTDIGLPAYLAHRHVKELLFRQVEDFEIGQRRQYARSGQNVIEIVSDPVFEGVQARSIFHGGTPRDWETIVAAGDGDWRPYRELTFRARTRAGGSRYTYELSLDVCTTPGGPEYLVARRPLRFDGAWKLYRLLVGRMRVPFAMSARSLAGLAGTARRLPS